MGHFVWLINIIVLRRIPAPGAGPRDVILLGSIIEPNNLTDWSSESTGEEFF